MPEEPEVETERVRESIVEHGGADRLLRTIALSTALLAACAAVAALQSGAAVNQALVLKTEATRLQAEASDQWAYYQAKGIKAAIQDASRTAWLASGKPPPAGHEAEQARYAKEQEEIKKTAGEKERERDVKSLEADHLLHRHHGFANAVALMQVAIALGAVAALTRLRPIWYGSLLIGAVGIAIFGLRLLR
jgi:hypothetical protein